jgi:hypothetical protein
MHRTHRHFKIVALLVSVSLGLLIHFVRETAASVDSPKLQVQTAWRNANLADSFNFATDLAQTTYPAPSLTNVGRSSRTESMHIEGNVDRPSETILMSLWSGTGTVLNAGAALELRVVRGAAAGRVGNEDWQSIDNVADAFAPSGDMLGFLAGATNIQRQGDATHAPVSLQPIVYTFDMDGPALAEHLRAQLEDQLAAKGELPAGVHLDTPSVYYGAVGSGEIWVTSDGYPTRLTLALDLPEQDNGERVTVHFTSQLNAFKSNRVTALTPNPFMAGLLSVVDSIEATFTPNFTLSFIFSFGLIVACVWLLIRLRRSRQLYRAVALTMIFAMVYSPLWQAGQVYAFTQNQSAQAAQQNATRQSQTESQDLLQQMYASTWNPNQNPLADPITPTLPIEPLPLNPDDVAALNFSPNIVRSTYNSLAVAAEVAPAATSDEDSDTLTYVQESRLGTDPTEADTDGDGLNDDAEVTGFSYNGQTWYSDPTLGDTNSDGLSDTEECPQRSGTLRNACQDTDNDGTPDIFDIDNDNDGVPDRIDLSPYGVMGTNGLVGHDPQAFTADNPMLFRVDGLERQANGDTGYQTFVDFQIRPTDTKHLWYALNVYDWPNGDTLGQIRRPITDTNGVANTTFATYDLSSSGSSANGDVRLVPMLEIRMSGNALPVPLITPHASQSFADDGITGTVTLDVSNVNDTQFSFSFESAGTYTATVEAGSCLAADKLISQAVTNGGSFILANQRVTALANGQNVVRLQKQSSTATTCFQLIDIPNGAIADKMVDTSFFAPYGVSIRDLNADTLMAYVPLNLTSDPLSGDRSAFSARMPYLLSDPGNWGQNQEVRVVWLVTMLTPNGGASVVQTYPDQWTLTGLSVREDRGLDLAIAFEDPVTDPNVNQDDRLGLLKQGLESSFLAGVDSNHDGQRDWSVADIRQNLDNTQNGSTTEEQRLGLPQNALRVYTYSYPQQDYLAQVMMTETVSLLNTHFTSGTLALAEAPLLLYAYEARSRQIDLGSGNGLATTDHNLLTLNLDPQKVRPQILAALNWTPYKYSHNAWVNYPLAQYADKLTVDFQTVFADSPATERPAEVALMQGTYLAAINGTSRLVEYQGRLQPDAIAQNDAEIAALNKEYTPFASVLKVAVKQLVVQIRQQALKFTDETKEIRNAKEVLTNLKNSIVVF